MENIIPKKSLDQNFLIDRNIASKIISLLDISPNDVLIEIGPGKGILTQFFFELKNTVYAIEIDKRCVEYLNDTLKKYSHINIIHQNFLDWTLEKQNFVKKELKWVGNLPYNITSSVLFKLIDLYPQVRRAVFMVQREVAERIVASHGNKDYGILSVLVQTFYSVKKRFVVSNSVFRPKPRVDSAVITLECRKNVNLGCELQTYQQVVKKAFNQRRKLLTNSLKSLFSQDDFENQPFEFHRRAEEVPVKEWKILSQHLHQKMIQN